MKKRSAIKTDLFADVQHQARIERLGDPLTEIEACIDFMALVQQSTALPRVQSVHYAIRAIRPRSV